MLDQVVNNAYISIEVDESALAPLYKSVASVLNILGVEAKVSTRPHVSIAYTLGETTLGKLDQIVADIAEAPFIIQTVGMDIIPGEMFNCDYVALAIKANDDFLYAQEFIAENCDIRTKFNGKDFIAHISLLTIDKGYESVHEELARVIELHSQEAIKGVQLKGKSISVFNQDRQLIIQKKL